MHRTVEPEGTGPAGIALLVLIGACFRPWSTEIARAEGQQLLEKA